MEYYLVLYGCASHVCPIVYILCLSFTSFFGPIFKALLRNFNGLLGDYWLFLPTPTPHVPSLRLYVCRASKDIKTSKKPVILGATAAFPTAG